MRINSHYSENNPCLNSLKQRILVIFLPMHNTDNREVLSEEFLLITLTGSNGK